MSPRPASTEPLAIGVIAGELAGAAAGAEPGWIKVTPRGRVQTRDGRSYAFDPEKLVARFSADGVDVPADRNHAIALLGAAGKDADAIGWAKELQARADGTYARVDWLPAGQATLAAGTHRYVSPTFPHDAAGNAAWLHSISLVAAPALSMPALLHALGYPESPMKQIAKALGLAEDADEAACLTALQKRAELGPVAQALGLPAIADMQACLSAIGARQPGDTVPKALHEQTVASLTAATGRIDALEKASRAERVDQLLDAAVKERKIFPAQRATLAALCATDDGFTQVKAHLAASPALLQSSGLDDLPPGGTDQAQDPATLAARARTIQDERAKAGQPIGYAEAVQLAAEAKA